MKSLSNIIEHKLRLIKHIYLRPEEEMSWLKSLNYKFDISIDAGANRGYISHVLSKKSNVVISIEPIDYLSKYLKSVLSKNCSVINAAASDVEGHSIIRIPLDKNGNDISALSSIEESNNFKDSHEVESYREININKISIDDLIKNNYQDRKVDFIKIDVEGHEETLLAGAKDCINTFKPIVLIEIEKRHGSSLSSIFSFFKRMGYESYAVKNRKLIRYSLDEFKFSQSNFEVGNNNYVSDIVFKF